MKLECEGKLGAENATEDDIHDAFADDKGRGEFVILSKSAQEYLQAWGQGHEPYVLEYREGNEASHMRAKGDLAREQVEACFILYLRGDPAWKTQHEWESLLSKPNAPWWKFW